MSLLTCLLTSWECFLPDTSSELTPMCPLLSSLQEQFPKPWKKVKNALDDMIQKGVITPETEPTEWVSQIVAVEKTNGDIQICLDPDI